MTVGVGSAKVDLNRVWLSRRGEAHGDVSGERAVGRDRNVRVYIVGRCGIYGRLDRGDSERHAGRLRECLVPEPRVRLIVARSSGSRRGTAEGHRVRNVDNLDIGGQRRVWRTNSGRCGSSLSRRRRGASSAAARGETCNAGQDDRPQCSSAFQDDCVSFSLLARRKGGLAGSPTEPGRLSALRRTVVTDAIDSWCRPSRRPLFLHELGSRHSSICVPKIVTRSHRSPFEPGRDGTPPRPPFVEATKRYRKRK